MKKNITLSTLTTIVAFGAGWFTCLKVNTFSVEQKAFYDELVDAQNEALHQAEKVMDNNELWDSDGSDDMVKYMEFYEKVDSIWATQL